MLRTCFACAVLCAQAALGQPAGGLPASLPSAPTAGSGYGLLWLDVDADEAAIALDGVYLDQDVWLISIAPGPHEINIRKPGRKPYANRFDISAGENLHLDVRLAPEADSLALGTDGRARGF